MSSFAYRPPLDGLRGVAVLSVFVFHAAPSYLTGGFIGVDVFFVLSGYLITSILLREFDSGEPWIGRFYTRRIRRLMPAVLVLLFTITPLMRLYGAPTNFGRWAGEARATIFYYANWNLIQNSDDYFAEGAGASPLRHMWSLAVEEQFYLVWPLALFGLTLLLKRRRRVVAVVAVAAIGSALLLNFRYSPTTVSRAYYGTDTRVFQPLFGAVLALVLYRSKQTPVSRVPALLRTPLIASSLALIGILSFTMSGDSASYFRYGALLAAAGTVGIILGLELAPQSVLANVLGSQPLTAFGRVSYGFYLWHWPVILWIAPLAASTLFDRFLVLASQFTLTLALTVASFVLIERPARFSGLRPKLVFPIAIVTMIGVSSWTSIVLRPASNDLVQSALEDPSVVSCPEDPQPCVQVEGLTPESPTVAIVGDSTAQMYGPALKALAEKYGFRYVQAAVGGCPIGHRLIATGLDGKLHKRSNFVCFDEMPGVYETLLRDFDPDLIIATSWNESNQHVTDGTLVQTGTALFGDEMRTHLGDAIDVLTSGGAQLVFVNILPGGPTVDCLRVSDRDSGTCLRPVQPSQIDEVNDAFREFAESRSSVAGVVSFTELLCPDEVCPLTRDGVVVRYDGGHLTGTESRLLAPELQAQLQALGIDISNLGRS